MMPRKFLSSLKNPTLARIREDGGTTLPSGITYSGYLSEQAKAAAKDITDNRSREKIEISDLNNRLARYIEQVRFLEAQNRVLGNDIGLFRQAAHIHSEKIHVYFQAEQTSLSTLMREHESKRANGSQNIRKMESEIVSARKNWEHAIESRRDARSQRKTQLKHLSDLEAETAFVKRLINDCEDEKAHLKTEISRIKAQIKKYLADRDKQRNSLSSHQKAAQELLRKVNASHTQHEIAIREEISKARRDSTDKNRQYFHKELHAAMKEVRDNFETVTKKTKKSWEEWYKNKMLEIKKSADKYSITQSQAREEILRIKSFVTELREKISSLETVALQLNKRIEDMNYRADEDLRMFEKLCQEKANAEIAQKHQLDKLALEIGILVENKKTLQAEIAKYKKLMENAEYLRTTYQSNVVIDTPSPIHRTLSHHSYGSTFATNAKEADTYNPYTDNYKYDHSYQSNYATMRSGNYASYYDSDNTYEEITPTIQISSADISDHSTINSQQFRSYAKGDVKLISHKDESITIENCNDYTSKDLSNWKLHHYVNGDLVGSYVFPIATHIHPNEKIVVHSMSSSVLLVDNIAPNITSFDFSKNTKTVLLDDADQEIGWYAHVTYTH